MVAKLLIAVMPHEATFGEKDYQQLLVIRRLVADLGLPIEIVAGQTVIVTVTGPPVALGVRHFAPPGLPVYVGFIEPGVSRRVTVPLRSAVRSWRLSALQSAAGGGAHLSVCG